MRSLVLAGFAAAMILSGCGGSDEPAANAAAPTSSPAATASPEKTPSAASDRTEIMALAKDYWQGVSSNDPSATCATLAPSERAHFKRKFGSCAKAFTFTAKQRKGSGDWRAGIVEISGDGAKITTVGDSGSEEGPKLYAVKEDGKWGIARRAAYVRVAH